MKSLQIASRDLIKVLLISTGALLALSAPATALAQADNQATYTIVFEATWNSATAHAHPDGSDAFPGSAHFSPLIGAVHDAETLFWENGALASPGIELMAESGLSSALASEVANAEGARQFLNGPAIASSPGQATLNDVVLTEEFSRLTLVTMIAPSPDWFLGVTGVNLFEAGAWVEARTLELHAYDAGTEEGNSYSTGNAATDPPQPIRQLSNHVLGTLTLTRLPPEQPVLFLPLLRR